MSFKFYRNEAAKRINSLAKLPREEDAGFDLMCTEGVTIKPGDSAIIGTGMHTAIPINWVGIVKDRSSVAIKGGVTAAGVIDSGYRGEIKVVMYNLGKTDLIFNAGDKIAQLVTMPHFPYSDSKEVQQLEDLGESERGAGGFGSTGR